MENSVTIVSSSSEDDQNPCGYPTHKTQAFVQKINGIFTKTLSAPIRNASSVFDGNLDKIKSELNLKYIFTKIHPNCKVASNLNMADSKCETDDCRGGLLNGGLPLCTEGNNINYTQPHNDISQQRLELQILPPKTYVDSISNNEYPSIQIKKFSIAKKAAKGSPIYSSEALTNSAKISDFLGTTFTPSTNSFYDKDGVSGGIYSNLWREKMKICNMKLSVFYPNLDVNTIRGYSSAKTEKPEQINEQSHSSSMKMLQRQRSTNGTSCKNNGSNFPNVSQKDGIEYKNIEESENSRLVYITKGLNEFGENFIEYLMEDDESLIGATYLKRNFLSLDNINRYSHQKHAKNETTSLHLTHSKPISLSEPALNKITIQGKNNPNKIIREYTLTPPSSKHGQCEKTRFIEKGEYPNLSPSDDFRSTPSAKINAEYSKRPCVTPHEQMKVSSTSHLEFAPRSLLSEGSIRNYVTEQSYLCPERKILPEDYSFKEEETKNNLKRRNISTAKEEPIMNKNDVDMDELLIDCKGYESHKAVVVPINNQFEPLILEKLRIYRFGRFNKDKFPDAFFKVLPSRVVSRSHFEIFSVKDEVFIQDLGSRGGTFINGVRISDPGKRSRVFRISDKDVIQVGKDWIADNFNQEASPNDTPVCHSCVKFRIQVLDQPTADSLYLKEVNEEHPLNGRPIADQVLVSEEILGEASSSDNSDQSREDEGKTYESPNLVDSNTREGEDELKESKPEEDVSSMEKKCSKNNESLSREMSIVSRVSSEADILSYGRFLVLRICNGRKLKGLMAMNESNLGFINVNVMEWSKKRTLSISPKCDSENNKCQMKITRLKPPSLDVKQREIPSKYLISSNSGKRIANVSFISEMKVVLEPLGQSDKSEGPNSVTISGDIKKEEYVIVGRFNSCRKQVYMGKSKLIRVKNNIMAESQKVTYISIESKHYFKAILSTTILISALSSSIKD